MATARVNGVQLAYELCGAGDDVLVLVHGSWGSRRNFDRVVPALAESFRVLTYDRRGHSESERPTAQGNVREDAADLAALIEHLDLAPAWVTGTSFGASIALRMAAARADLVRGVIVHEPPLFALLANDPSAAPMLTVAAKKVAAVADRIASGDHAGAAEQFVETVAFGPGTWARFTPDMRRTFVENAPTFLDEARDPEQLVFDLATIRAFPRPVLLSKGDRSPPAFALVIALLAGAMPAAKVVTFPGAGHAPHVTHPDAYIDAVTAFVRGSTSTASTRRRSR